MLQLQTSHCIQLLVVDVACEKVFYKLNRIRCVHIYSLRPMWGYVYVIVATTYATSMLFLTCLISMRLNDKNIIQSSLMRLKEEQEDCVVKISDIVYSSQYNKDTHHLMFYLETGQLCKNEEIRSPADACMRQYYYTISSCDGYYLGENVEPSLVRGASLY